MADFREFTNSNGDPILIHKAAVATVTLNVLRRGERHERVETVFVMITGGRFVIEEPFNDVREWLMGTIS